MPKSQINDIVGGGGTDSLGLGEADYTAVEPGRPVASPPVALAADSK